MAIKFYFIVLFDTIDIIIGGQTAAAVSVDNVSSALGYG